MGNKAGINKKFETPQKNFESGLGRKIDFTVPFEAEIYGYHNGGVVLIDSHKEAKFSKAMNHIAAKFMPESTAAKETRPKKTGFLDKLKSKK